MKQSTFLWHDYETFGVNPQKDHPAQFAAIRTDEDLNEIDKPINWYCQPVNDYLPSPQACLITNITPQQALRDGYPQAEFAKMVFHEMSKPNTCVAGYNSLRFDDEVTRYTFYRNFIDPYAREWQNGNSRWDIIDLVRTCYALRPDGIQWPRREDDLPSFKLEQLSVENDITHANAHDALSDVRATIGVARLIKQKQPRLYQYYLRMRNKKTVLEQIDIIKQTPFVHISSKLPASQGCCTLIMPICAHPENRNMVVGIDLNENIDPLLSLSAEQLAEKLYTPNLMLEKSESRLPIKGIHINKCPAIAPVNTLSEQRAEQLGIRLAQCRANWKLLRAHSDISQKLQDMYLVDLNNKPELDPDYALYSGGFFSDSDRFKMEKIRQSDPTQLSGNNWQFDDPRLNTMLYRYRARNYPSTLSAEEVNRWQQHRQQRLVDSGSEYGVNLTNYYNELTDLAALYQHDPVKLRVLRDLHQYAENL